MLLGHTVALTGHRRSDECSPPTSTASAPTSSTGRRCTRGRWPTTTSLLRQATQTVLDDPPDYLLATTGIGIRGWINAAASWRARSELIAALTPTAHPRPRPEGGRVPVGGRPVGVVRGRLRAHGGHGRPPPPATAHGPHVALQLPGDAMESTIATLEAAGARVTTIPVYEWTWPEDLEPARRMLRAIASARVSAVTFTSRPAVRHFSALAKQEGVHDEVAAALQHDVLSVCIGPTTSDALADLLGASSTCPERCSWAPSARSWPTRSECGATTTSPCPAEATWWCSGGSCTGRAPPS